MKASDVTAMFRSLEGFPPVAEGACCDMMTATSEFITTHGVGVGQIVARLVRPGEPRRSAPMVGWSKAAPFLQIAFCPWCGAQWKDNRWHKAEKAETKEGG